MGLNIKVGCGIREILRVGYRMKIAWWDQDALISIGGMQVSFEIDGDNLIICFFSLTKTYKIELQKVLLF